MEDAIQAFGPLFAFALALLFVDMLVPSKSVMRRRRRAKERARKRKAYQDRRLANDAEHAKVTRAIRYDVLRRL